MRYPEFRTVAVVLFDGAPLFESAVPIAVFGTSSGGRPSFDLRVASETTALETSGGLGLSAPCGLSAVGDADVVIVPTFLENADTPPSDAVCEALRGAHARGATVVGLCLGAFVLAAAGLLDGRPATTHWHLAPELARRYPAVQVREGELYVDDGEVLTSAGSAAGLDLCLHLVRRSFGAAAAARIARMMVVAPHRAGGQAQYISRPVAEVGHDDPLAAVLAWAQGNLDRRITVDEMARRSAMSRRSFDRHFRATTGSTPVRWLLHQRLLRAQELLETSDHTVEETARLSGFTSVVSFRSHFRERFGVSPSAYRSSFSLLPPG